MAGGGGGGAGQTGTASVTVRLKNEGGLAATNQFLLVVRKPPAFNQALGKVQIARGQTYRGAVKASDADIPAAQLQLKARVEPLAWVAPNVLGDGAEWTVELAARDAAPGRGKLILELSDGELSATNESILEVVPPEAPVFVTAPQGITEIPAGKTSPPLAFVISNKNGTPYQIQFSVSSNDKKAIPDENLTVSNDGASGICRLPPVTGPPDRLVWTRWRGTILEPPPPTASPLQWLHPPGFFAIPWEWSSFGWTTCPARRKRAGTLDIKEAAGWPSTWSRKRTFQP